MTCFPDHVVMKTWLFNPSPYYVIQALDLYLRFMSLAAPYDLSRRDDGRVVHV